MPGRRLVVWIILFIVACLCSVGVSALDGPLASAWIVEWDFENGMADLAALDDAVPGVQIFAASFSAADKPVVKDSLRQVLREKADALAGKQVFLTVVNDRVDDDGKAILKDPDLVTRLLATPESREAHRRDLLDVLASGDFAGLDIDYERVKAEDWQAFLDFCASLAAELEPAGKRLRVVLEPGARFFASQLPAGPEYVVMAYNFFGGHSGPGPKANPAFLARLAHQARRAGADVRLALSTGGFVWPATGAATSVTETAAHELARRHGAGVSRDVDSHYLFFGYSEGGVDHTVWYADAATLRHLLRTGRRMGFEAFDIWRLGGLSRQTLDMFRQESWWDGIPLGRVLEVGPGRRFESIGAAIAAAEAGDSVVVDAGEYRESLWVEKPGLTVTSREAVAGKTVRVVPAGGEHALYDSADTVWRGVAFSGDGPVVAGLSGFTGRFEHCSFVSAGGSADSTVVSVYEGGPVFRGCTIMGRAGYGIRLISFPADPSAPGATVDIAYSLLEGFRGAAFQMIDKGSARLANCVVARNNLVLFRSRTSTGPVEIVNCILYNNRGRTLTNFGASPTPAVFTNCLVTPVLNSRFRVNGLPIDDQPGVAAHGCRILSPRFVRSGRPIFVNFGIDDTMNAGVFDAVGGEAEKHGFPMTLAINTASADAGTWDEVRRFVARGHEIGSHTVNHTAVEINVPLAVGYSGQVAEADRVLLTIERGKALTVDVGQGIIHTLRLDEADLTLQELAARLRRFGLSVRAQHQYYTVPAAMLADVSNVDISFPEPSVPLCLATASYLNVQLNESFAALRDNLPDAPAFPFINPFGITSPLTNRRIADAGFVSARAVTPLSPGLEEPDADDDGAVDFNVYNIPCATLGARPVTNEAERLTQSFLLMLDAAKEDKFGVSFYAHTYQETSLEQWRELFRLAAADPNVTVATLGRIVDAARASGIAVGDHHYRAPLHGQANDYRLRSDSPARGTGISLGLARDFAGNPVPADAMPDLGMYQYTANDSP